MGSIFMGLDCHRHAFCAARLMLAIFPAQARIAIVYSKTGGNGVAQVFARAHEVVIIQDAPPVADQADNHAARAAFLWCIRWRSVSLSVWLRLGGR